MTVRKTKFSCMALAALAIVLILAPCAHALTAGETYTVSVYKIEGDGSTSLASSTTATADGSGKLAFTLNSVPTNAVTNFLYCTIADSSATIVRKGFSPAPPPGLENLLGINSLSTSQAAAMIKAGEVAGTDDPILVAFGLVLTRSPGITDADITRIVTVGNAAIRGEDGDTQGAGLGSADGFIGFLKSKGVTDTQLDLMRDKLVYNSADGTKDLRSFTALFKDAVDTGDDGEMSKAGGYMAEIFIDAGNSAGIDPGLILSAHQAAGEVTNKTEYSALLAAMDSSVMRGIEQSMSSFFTRAAAAKLETNYAGALTALNTPLSEVAAYNAAVQTMVTAFEAIETTYVDYFMDPDGYVSDNSTTHNAVQGAINTAFDSAFSTFQTNVASSGTYINTLKSTVAASLGINLTDPPVSDASFGQECPFNSSDCSDSGTWVNWPIPRSAMVIWVANVISGGGSVSYTRDTLTVPTNMAWLNGGSGDRVDYTHVSYTSGNASFDALMGLQEDIKIIEFARWDAWDNAGSITQEEMMELEKLQGALFESRLSQAVARIGGTTDGTTAITAAQKAAIVQLLVQPSLH